MSYTVRSPHEGQLCPVKDLYLTGFILTFFSGGGSTPLLTMFIISFFYESIFFSGKKIPGLPVSIHTVTCTKCFPTKFSLRK